MQCEIKKVTEGLFLDFHGKTVNMVKINGKAVSPAEVFGHQRIKIPAGYQEAGKINTFEIGYENEYAKNGQGLHIFEDPVDNEQYLYTQFESFYAHKMFPCFDQPNLKAIMQLITITPSKWTSIITNEYEDVNVELEPSGESLKKLDKFGINIEYIKNMPRESHVNLRIFKETPKLSTYLYAIIAGPYEMFVKPKEANMPPMRIFVRRSLKKFVEKDVEEFFYITKKGIEYYESIFGVKFPFNKYDQIYVPEFNWGGMENAGAVTYTENLVFKDAATHQNYMRFANVILHELAHQWFGDLVTMNWWNDIWLNESFATFISFLCMTKQPGLERYNSAWKMFNLQKERAYRDDQLPTTHPIAGKIENTEDAENVFDGITYQKGASSMKQLYYFIGETCFVEGLKEYFPKYQWSNSKLEYLIECFQHALKKHGSDIILTNWVDTWLKTSGTNELEPNYTVKDGKISEFSILQKSAEFGDKINRVHRLVIGVFDENYKETLFENILVKDTEKTIIPQLVGINEPKAVFLNINDFAYAKIRLDAKSFKAFTNDLHKVPDALTRQMIIRSVWDMVRDCMEPATKFLEVIRTNVFFAKL